MEIEGREYLKQWENLTINELLYPRLLYYSRWLMEIMLLITTPLFVFTTFVVTKKSSPAMGRFKFVLLGQLICSMCVEIILCSMNFFIPLPLPIIAANTPFPLKKEWIAYIFAVIAFFGVAVIGLFIFAFAFRVATVLSESFISRKCRRLLIKIGICLAIGGWISISVPLVLMLSNPDEIQKAYEIHVPASKEFFKLIPVSVGLLHTSKNSILGMYVNLQYFEKNFNFLGTLEGFFAASELSIAALTLGGLNAIFIYRMKKVEKTLSKETWALQRMLYKFVKH